jgi:hypothetical protein
MSMRRIFINCRFVALCPTPYALRPIHTPQGGTIEDNAADDILMVDQGSVEGVPFYGSYG